MSLPTSVWTICLCALALFVWEFVAQANPRVVFFVGSPVLIWHELQQMVSTGEIFGHFWTTTFEAFAGLVLGTLAGSSLGISFWYYQFVSRVVSPILLAFGAIPILVFAPLMIIWFGVGLALKVVLAFLATFFVAYAQASRGANSVSAEQTDLLNAMGATRREVFRMAIVPGSLHWVLGSMRVLVGLSLLGAFIGEFIAAERGLGYLILRASSLYNMPRAMAAAIGIVVAAVLFDWMARIVESRRVEIARRLSVPARLR